MYFPPSFSVYLIIGSFVKSTSFSTISWHSPFSTTSGGKGFSMALDSLCNNCSFFMFKALAISSLEETRPATTGMLDSFTFSKNTGFSPRASIIPAISYSVDTSFLILISSPFLSSCSKKLLKPNFPPFRKGHSLFLVPLYF